MKVFPVKTVKGMFVSDDEPSELDVVALLDKAGLILKREVHNLTMASAAGKLLPAHARDLVAYVKLLSELRDKQEADAAAMTDDELQKLASK